MCAVRCVARVCMCVLIFWCVCVCVCCVCGVYWQVARAKFLFFFSLPFPTLSCCNGVQGGKGPKSRPPAPPRSVPELTKMPRDCTAIAGPARRRTTCVCVRSRARSVTLDEQSSLLFFSPCPHRIICVRARGFVLERKYPIRIKNQLFFPTALDDIFFFFPRCSDRSGNTEPRPEE